ncbi:MAG: biopolymer transporter ExbD [Pseudomonadota bacterium]
MITASRRRRRTLSITSLIDVIFLLLLFFMLASTFQQFSELEVAGVSGRGSSAATPEDAPLRLVIQPGGLSLNGASTLQDQMVERLSAPSGEPKRLSVEVAPGVTSQRLIDVLVRLEPISDLEVNLVVPS